MMSLTRASLHDEKMYPEYVGLQEDGFPDASDPAIVNGTEYYVIDTAKLYKYDLENKTWREVPTGGGGGGGGGDPIVTQGYYHDGQFYYDQEYTQAIVPKTNYLYYDKTAGKIYLYTGSEYKDFDQSKMDAPVNQGQPNQVLTYDEDGQPVWKNVSCNVNDITQTDGDFIFLNGN